MKKLKFEAWVRFASVALQARLMTANTTSKEAAELAARDADEMLTQSLKARERFDMEDLDSIQS